jgi:hypothetical protein
LLNLKELFKFSQEVELQFEEIVFLYALHDRVESPEDLEFKGLFNWYMTRFQYYNRNGDKSYPILWVNMINKLIDEGFIDDLRSSEEKEKKSVLVSKLKVTKKFTDLLIVGNSKDYWWEFYIEIWKENAATIGEDNIPVVTGTSIYILKPDSNNPKMNTIEKIKNVFWDEFCQKGNKEALNKFFGNTEKYLSENGANMKICNFFACYKDMFIKKK